MNAVIGHYTTLPQAEGHFGYYNAKTFIVGSGNTLLAAYLSHLDLGLAAIFAALLGCYLLTLFVLAYFSLKFFPHPWEGRASLAISRSLLTFGLKNQLGKAVGQIQAQYAKYLLAGVSALALSAYAIGQALVYKLVGGIAQVATALYPAAARTPTRSPAFVRLYHRLQLGLFGLALLGIALYHWLGLPFLTWWLHAPTLVAVVDQIMRVFVWYFAILVLTPLASSTLDGRGHPGLTSLFAVAAGGLEVVFALLLFPRFGLFAPVYAAVLSTLLTTPPLLWTTEKVLRS